ncbi:hypothetical protein D3C73_1351000 [compost metagenome]
MQLLLAERSGKRVHYYIKLLQVLCLQIENILFHDGNMLIIQFGGIAHNGGHFMTPL